MKFMFHTNKKYYIKLTHSSEYRYLLQKWGMFDLSKANDKKQLLLIAAQFKKRAAESGFLASSGWVPDIFIVSSLGKPQIKILIGVQMIFEIAIYLYERLEK